MSGTGPRFGSKLDRVGPTCWDRELAYFCPPPLQQWCRRLFSPATARRGYKTKQNARTGAEPGVAASVPIKTGIFTNGSKVSPGSALDPWTNKGSLAVRLFSWWLYLGGKGQFSLGVFSIVIIKQLELNRVQRQERGQENNNSKNRVGSIVR